jgi:UDP:flavonoid glycosyltransferase YjiC (YdhE family)
MDSAKNGVVLVSFGSSPQSRAMPAHIKQAFLDAFDEFPQVKFLWKFENATVNIAKGHPNVLTREWIPQVDILSEF